MGKVLTPPRYRLRFVRTATPPRRSTLEDLQAQSPRRSRRLAQDAGQCLDVAGAEHEVVVHRVDSHAARAICATNSSAASPETLGASARRGVAPGGVAVATSSSITSRQSPPVERVDHARRGVGSARRTSPRPSRREPTRRPALADGVRARSVAPTRAAPGGTGRNRRRPTSAQRRTRCEHRLGTHHHSRGELAVESRGGDLVHRLRELRGDVARQASRPRRAPSSGSSRRTTDRSSLAARGRSGAREPAHFAPPRPDRTPRSAPVHRSVDTRRAVRVPVAGGSPPRATGSSPASARCAASSAARDKTPSWGSASRRSTTSHARPAARHVAPRPRGVPSAMSAGEGTTEVSHSGAVVTTAALAQHRRRVPGR